jgi:hypothetical protein
MPNKTTLAACLVTMAVIVPAGWHALDADIQSDGKRLRPLQQSFVIDGTRVTLDVDRRVVMTGDTIKATLVAFSDIPKQVSIDLIVLHSSNYEGERVEQPWVPIDREVLKLTAAPRGGKPIDTMLTLGERPRGPALVDDFKVYVTQHGNKPPRREGDDRVDYDIGVTDGTAAAVAITGWSGDNLKMSIVAEGRPTGNEPFTVAVKIKNTSGESLAHHPWVSLSTESALEGTEEAEHEDAGVAIERVYADRADGEGEGGMDEVGTLERGEVTVARFRVTPNKQGLRKLTFLASAFESDDMPGPIKAGAMDARTFTLTDATPAVAAK